MRCRLVAFLIVAVVTPSTCWGQRVRIPVRIETGWETTFYPVGEVAPNSEVATKGSDGSVLSFTVYRLWFVVPFWNGSAQYVLSQPYERGKQPDEVFAFVDQSASNVSKLTGIPQDRLSRPWSSYIPLRWPIVI